MSQIFTQTQSTILNDLQLLNSQDQQTVLDFIHFLMSKNQPENIENFVIIDTGVLVAYFNRREQWHSWAKVQLAKIQPPLLTCEAVEVVY